MTTPTIEERVAQLEGTSRTHEAMLNVLISIGERQQEMLDRHQETSERHQETQGRQQETLDRHQALLERQQALLERQQETLDRQQEMLDRQQEMLDRQQEMLAEVRRDAQQTQRLWVRLAQRYGWLDDNDDIDQG